MKGPERGPEGGSRRGGPGFVYTPLHFVSRPKNNLEKIITVCQDSFLTRWHVELFAKNTFLGHFGHFQPGKGQIIYSSNYSTQHLQNDNIRFSTGTAFYDIFAWACTTIKLFWVRMWPTFLGFLGFHRKNWGVQNGVQKGGSRRGVQVWLHPFFIPQLDFELIMYIYCTMQFIIL